MLGTRKGLGACEDDGTTWFFSSCDGILELRRGFQASSCVGPGKPKLPFALLLIRTLFDDFVLNQQVWFGISSIDSY